MVVEHHNSSNHSSNSNSNCESIHDADANDEATSTERLGMRRRPMFLDEQTQQKQQQQQQQQYHMDQRIDKGPTVESSLSQLQQHKQDEVTTKQPPPSSHTITPTHTQIPPPTTTTTSSSHSNTNNHNHNHTLYSPESLTGRILIYITHKLPLTTTRSGSALPGFLSLLLLTMANYMLSPMRDAAALAVGVSYIPILTLASAILALASSVPMGWLFEAPNPERKGRTWRSRVGLTRGETQGTSLALFLRCFAICLVGYALTFKVLEWFDWHMDDNNNDDLNDTTTGNDDDSSGSYMYIQNEGIWIYLNRTTTKLLQKFGKVFYVAFFLVVHLMKLHSMSLIWGVTSEAMEYEEQAENRERRRKKELKKMIRTNASGGNDTTIYSSVVSNHHGCGDDDDDEDDDDDDDNDNNGNGVQRNKKPSSGKQTKIRLKRLAFVGFGGTLGGILGSVFVSITAQTLRLSGLLVVAATLLLLSAELSTELGQIMLRHWEEEQNEILQSSSDENLLSLGQAYGGSGSGTGSGLGSGSTTDHQISQTFSTSTGTNNSGEMMNQSTSSISNSSGLDSSMKRVNSFGMKRSASGVSINSISIANNGNAEGIDTCMKKVSSMGSMKRVASGNSIAGIRRAMSSQVSLNAMDNKEKSSATFSSTEINASGKSVVVQNVHIQPNQEEMVSVDDNTFRQRLFRGVTTILRSRLLMTIFTYNALYATTSTLLSFQRAELVANRSSTTNSMSSDTAFLAKINIISSVAVFALQASGLGAYIASRLGQRGTLSLMPTVRMFGVSMLFMWHMKAGGAPPNLTFFLVLDEFTKVINFAVAKPVRESLWRGLSNEARYEAKPIVDTLANRWGSGSAAFLMSLLDRIMVYKGAGEQLDGTRTLFGFPPLLILCVIAATWWAFVSADLGNTRHKIDLELKKQQ